MNTAEIKELASRYLMKTYPERGIALVRGSGTRVWDADGKEYVDFGSGIAVCSLGHCHPRVTRAIQEQAAALVHVSNLYLIEPQVRLARLLCEHSFAQRAFFCNSGAEANEGAIKLARKYAKDLGRPERYEVVSMQGSFHGRTLATVAATGQEKVHRGFEPLPDGFRHAPWDDPAGLEASISGKTAALLIEPVQGEGGIRPASREFLEKARALCDELDLLLIYDEVQCGMGRTGALFAYQRYGVEPDVMTLAKALGNGFPIGAILAGPRAAAVFTPGTHAATFGGNPLGCAAAAAAVEAIIEEQLPARAKEVGEFALARLRALAAEKECIREVRGVGLMIGVEMDREVAPIVSQLAERGFIAISAGPNVLRLVPPLVITREEIESLIEVLRETLPS